MTQVIAYRQSRTVGWHKSMAFVIVKEKFPRCRSIL